ncbi:aminoglycoside 6'-N-acetyltransferase [Lederbergia graminis]|uniref:Aminoglycoside N(6')-acetyltransferase type 1 n=1 Tax=Lederbergia graminis TaxID=735518 RepID=A0ABW0LG67_9BACI
MISQATLQNATEAAQLALLLWPDHTLQELVDEMEEFIQSEDSAVFLAFHDNEAIGFAHCQLRFDYVEGTSTSPVGYLEGIFVKDEFRKQGFARKLVLACEQWAREKGCTEFASDCELDNADSLKMHVKLGFDEANRIICFTKKI